MPLYDYDCANCGRRFEVLHGVDAPPPTACPLCGGGPVKKTITAPAVHYKGSGWAKKERRATAAPGKSTGSSERGDSDHAASTSDGSGSKVDTNGSGGSGSSGDSGDSGDSGKAPSAGAVAKGDGADKKKPSERSSGAGSTAGD